MRKGRVSESGIMWLNIAFSLLLLPLLANAGSFIHIILLPVVFYMIWSEKLDYFPGLIILLISESFIIWVILFCCFVVVVVKWKRFFYSELRRLWLLSFIPLPFLSWVVYSRIGELNYTLVNGIYPLQYYLGLFPFFYGVLIVRNLKNYHLVGILMVLFISFIINISGIYEQTVRIIFFAIPLLITFCIVDFIRKPSSSANIIIRILSIVVLIIWVFINANTLTILGSIFFAVVIALNKKYSPVGLTRFFTSIWPFVITIIFVAITIKVVPSYRPNRIRFQETDNRNMGYSDTGNILERIKAKSFSDRGPIWSSVWLEVTNGKNILPQVEYRDLKMIGRKGQIRYNAIQAHNIFLELLRRYGIVIGFIIGFLYISFIIKSGMIFRVNELNSYLLSISSSVFSVGVVGGMTGQYVLMPAFSFLFMGLAGICYESYNSDRLND